MEVHNALRPGMVRVTSAAVEKEFAQFVFSLLLEILDACLVSMLLYDSFALITFFRICVNLLLFLFHLSRIVVDHEGVDV